jgi:hypothetical protein
MRLIHSRALLAAGGVILALAACSQDLSIPNNNQPDTKRAISTPSDVEQLAATALSDWHAGTNAENPALAFAVMADALTGSYNNFGMNLSSSEPRIAYPNNTTGGDYTAMAQDPWYNNYTALGEANDALTAMANGLEVSDGYKEVAELTQGLTLGNIALIFDKGWTVDETMELPVPVEDVKPYGEVAAFALSKLDAVIAATASATWELPNDVLPLATVDPTAENIGKIANTMAARILAYTPRNSTENDAVDWARVLQYASHGISSGTPFDFSVIEDNGTIWWDGYKAYGNYGPWLRVSMRVIHEMNPSLPERYTSCSSIAQDSTGFADARYATDFTYVTDIPFACARGAWHFSNWEHSRYGTKATTGDVTWFASTFTGAAPMVLAAENDLLWAEALVRTGGDLNLAADKVNNTRVGRGHLPAVGPNADDIMDAIHYEQDVELLTTGGGLQWWNRRRIDGLQPGTPRHLPIPAKELEVDELPIYTFGGAAPNPVYGDQ